MREEMIYKLYFSVLVYDEDDHLVAHCLEMDLMGRGATEQKALKAVMELIVMQVSYAFHKKEPGLLYHPAERKYFKTFSRLKKEMLASYPEQPKEQKYSIFQVPMPKPQAECFAVQ